MEYAVGKTGRVIAARLFEGEDLYECIEQIAEKENIKSAAVLITGGFRKASVVVGPKQEEPKITGDFKDFTGPGEVLGVGTIYCDDEGPKMHLHSAIGKEGQVMKARVIRGAAGPQYFVWAGEIITSRKEEAGNGVRYLSPLYCYDLKKMGCLEMLEETRPEVRPAKRPLRNVRKMNNKDSQYQ